MSGVPAPTAVVRLAAIRSEPLSVDEVLAAVRRPAAGGVAVFIGTVRDHDDDRPVALLDYTAHPTAAARLREIVAEVASDHDHDAVAVAALHRVGALDVGEVAVIVAASAVHRADAFRIARRLIDRIKAEVPLWKNQEFGDGTTEWVGVEG